jgi:hypothetical protein
VTLAEFHDQELIQEPDACLAKSFFDEWSVGNQSALPLLSDSCVGYRVPLYLGGEDVIANLEVVDIHVYWGILGQIRAQLLPPNSRD